MQQVRIPSKIWPRKSNECNSSNCCGGCCPRSRTPGLSRRAMLLRAARSSGSLCAQAVRMRTTLSSTRSDRSPSPAPQTQTHSHTSTHTCHVLLSGTKVSAIRREASCAVHAVGATQSALHAGSLETSPDRTATQSVQGHLSLTMLSPSAVCASQPHAQPAHAPTKNGMPWPDVFRARPSPRFLIVSERP